MKLSPFAEEANIFDDMMTHIGGPKKAHLMICRIRPMPWTHLAHTRLHSHRQNTNFGLISSMLAPDTLQLWHLNGTLDFCSAVESLPKTTNNQPKFPVIEFAYHLNWKSGFRESRRTAKQCAPIVLWPGYLTCGAQNITQLCVPHCQHFSYRLILIMLTRKKASLSCVCRSLSLRRHSCDSFTRYSRPYALQLNFCTLPSAPVPSA